MEGTEHCGLLFRIQSLRHVHGEVVRIGSQFLEGVTNTLGSFLYDFTHVFTIGRCHIEGLITAYAADATDTIGLDCRNLFTIISISIAIHNVQLRTQETPQKGLRYVGYFAFSVSISSRRTGVRTTVHRHFLSTDRKDCTARSALARAICVHDRLVFAVLGGKNVQLQRMVGVAAQTTGGATSGKTASLRSFDDLEFMSTIIGVDIVLVRSFA
mmetsp:Transcript_40081/g.72201  ORF Transcript_40081/g.72201 Transcript_40081/m.72201 type:complete len:213 (+) Transcript_40081:410-1048(+)